MTLQNIDQDLKRTTTFTETAEEDDRKMRENVSDAQNGGL